jgi:hypothetical protein
MAKPSSDRNGDVAECTFSWPNGTSLKERNLVAASPFMRFVSPNGNFEHFAGFRHRWSRTSNCHKKDASCCSSSNPRENDSSNVANATVFPTASTCEAGA